MIGLKPHNFFFDSPKVTRAVDKATRRVFSKFGAFVRRTAKGSIRKRKRPSAAGQPPSSHTGLLKKFIFFGYEPQAKSVVIGPVRLSHKGRGEAPSLLEHGGFGKVDGKRTRYRPRPFMSPAMEQEQPKLPAMWRDSVK